MHGSGDDYLPIFGPDAGNVVPGEVVVQLRTEVAAGLTVSIPAGPSRGLTGFSAGFGVDDLDGVLNGIGVTSVTAVHPPPPPRVERGFAVAAELTPMTATYKVRFDPANEVGDVVDRLAALGEVEAAEPNRYRESFAVPNDPDYAQQWGLAKINCPAAWDRSTGSANVTVAVVDSGVDLNHPQLAPLLLPGSDLVDLGPNPTPAGLPPGFVLEGDFFGRDNDPQDEVGHGTHVAGTIACLSNDGVGVAGVTWNCRLLPVRVLARVRHTPTGRIRGMGSSADIAAGIRWAADHGAHVINLSLGGSANTFVERDAVAYAIGRGVVVVAAMGNDGTNNPSFPAAFPDVIAVGAIEATDRRAAFSQTGPHIDVAAPGVNVLSTYWDDTYAISNGTSMAAPHVAGVAALILSCNPGLPGAQVGQIIRDTARPLRDNPGDPLPNEQYGSGLVDARAALDRACPPRRTLTPVPCRPSLPIFTCPSIRIPCVPLTREVICRVTVQLPCPSIQIPCRSVQIRCPTGPGSPLGMGEDYESYDPYGDDPYGIDYGQ
ncbi:S8 family serine peptidase [Nonomuraea sp. NPDC050547]|uniref:peptidase S8 n=1 Tax=unclassified Nonomuraea TaxID=2593643 RepID=UPI0037AB7CDB